MGLKDIKIRTRTVKISGESVALRGLSTADISFLIDAYGSTFTGQVDEAIATLSSGTGDLQGSLTRALAIAPDLVADVIALAANEPDAVDIVKNLPAPDQLEALNVIGSLMFEEPDSVKKFAKNVIALMRGARMIPSAFGSTESSPPGSKNTGTSSSDGS